MDEEAIKQQLYNRQGYVVGAETQRKYGEMRVAIVGLGGPGCELAKNLILTGIKQVTLVDDAAITWHDLSTVFYATEADIGSPMAKTLLPRLAELNRFATVTVAAADANNLCPDEILKQQHVVVYCNKNTTLLTRENDLCRAHGVRFVACESRGVACSVFVDTGDEFTINDKNGEELVTCVVTDIDQDNNIIMVNDDKKHETEPGDKVYFTDIAGCTTLNSADPAEPLLFEVIEVVTPFAVKIKLDDAGSTLKSAATFTGRGYMHTTKQPVTVRCKSLARSIAEPDFSMVFDDEAKLCAGGDLHAMFRALHQVAAGAATHAPITTPVDLAALTAAAGADANADLINLIGPALHGSLNPMACFLGGFAAQEVLKCGSGKFTPVFQWMYYDARELIQAIQPGGVVPPESERQPINSRYDGQICVFGRRFQEQLQATSAFIVGAGALGCEHIKNVAMIGIGCPADPAAPGASRITITDMDTIELSNLSRQFLFRAHHIGKPKSTVAGGAAAGINAALRVEALEQKVARETENVFGEAFWESQHVVMNALDNVQARKYVDERCVDFQRPLFESGTLGAKCNTQCVIPFLTENYGNSADPPERDIPLCTLKNTPSAIEHTIQWARDAFHGYFVQGPSDVAAYLADPAAFLAGLAKDPSNKPTVLKSLVDGIAKKPTTAADCVAWARHRFEDSFNHNIRQLLHNMPADFVTPNGQPFWSGARRPPTPLDFKASDDLHMLFVKSAAGIIARVYGLSAPLAALAPAEIARIAESTPVPGFVPRKVQYATGNEAKQEDPTTIAASDLTDADMPDPAAHPGLAVAPEEFEKDDDANGHIDFVTATSNLRATNYGIPVIDRIKTKMIAGKIIPAMITTTALVTGLVAIEVLKYIAGGSKIPRGLYRNAFVNIALPLVALSEPVEVPKGTEYISNDGRKMAFTMWDKVEAGDGSPDITVGDAIDSIEERYGVDVCMMSTPGGLLVYNGMMPNPKSRSVLMREKLETLFKKPLDESIKTVSLVLNATVGDEDLDLPAVRFRIRK